MAKKCYQSGIVEKLIEHVGKFILIETEREVAQEFYEQLWSYSKECGESDALHITFNRLEREGVDDSSLGDILYIVKVLWNIDVKNNIGDSIGGCCFVPLFDKRYFLEIGEDVEMRTNKRTFKITELR